jgi:hypothetical protein
LALQNLVVGVRSDPRTKVIPLHGLELLLLIKLPLRAWTLKVFESGRQRFANLSSEPCKSSIEFD